MALERPQHRTGLRIRRVDGELVILNGQTEQIHQLNVTASYIWNCCDGQTDILEIARKVTEEFSIPLDISRRDVRAVVDDFRSLALLDSN